MRFEVQTYRLGRLFWRGVQPTSVQFEVCRAELQLRGLVNILWPWDLDVVLLDLPLGFRRMNLGFMLREFRLRICGTDL